MCTTRTDFSRCRGRAPKSPPKPQGPIGWVRLPSPDLETTSNHPFCPELHP